MMKDRNIETSSAVGATILMLGQVFTKLMTFVINQLLIRFISAHIFGVTSFMEVLISCALFYSREGIRLTCQRINDENNLKTDSSRKGKIMAGTTLATLQSILNLSLLPVIIGIPTTLILITQLPSLSIYKYHTVSTVLLFVSTIVELLSEPFYNFNQFKLNFKMRTKIESLSLVTKCISQFGITIYLTRYQYLNSGYYILAFIIAQFLYSSTILVSYAFNYYYYKQDTTTTPFIFIKIYTQDNNYYYFDRDLIKYWASLILQLFFKYMLTEGDRFLLSYLCSTDEQGIFALITNYGSLIARLLFAPIEETLRIVLTKSFANNNDLFNKKIQLLSVLNKILKFYIYLSLIIIIFAPLNSKFLLSRLIGDKWTSSNDLLFQTFKAYWIYIPFLSINGIMEASFYSITSDPREIFKYSKIMVSCSIVYFLVLVISIKYLQLSLLGLIFANILNMCLRIVYCTRALNKFLAVDNLKLSSIISDTNYINALISSLAIYCLHIRFIGNEITNLQSLVKSGFLAVLLLSNFLLIERNLIFDTVKPILRNKKD